MPRGAVVERPLVCRFELDFPGGQAFAIYRSDSDRLIVSHTEVPAAFNGQGIGSRLAEGIFQLARASGRRVVPRCSLSPIGQGAIWTIATSSAEGWRISAWPARSCRPGSHTSE
jgi:predicted GNAT family acetyltransferase